MIDRNLSLILFLQRENQHVQAPVRSIKIGVRPQQITSTMLMTHNIKQQEIGSSLSPSTSKKVHPFQFTKIKTRMSPGVSRSASLNYMPSPRSARSRSRSRNRDREEVYELQELKQGKQSKQHDNKSSRSSLNSNVRNVVQRKPPPLYRSDSIPVSSKMRDVSLC